MSDESTQVLKLLGLDVEPIPTADQGARLIIALTAIRSTCIHDGLFDDYARDYLSGMDRCKDFAIACLDLCLKQLSERHVYMGEVGLKHLECSIAVTMDECVELAEMLGG